MKTFAIVLLLAFVSFNACKSADKKIKGPKGEYVVQAVQGDTVSDKKITLILKKVRLAAKACATAIVRPMW